MQNNRLNIPKRIKVGFQERSETYTGKLAYITYFNGNNVAKEKSFENWRNKDIPTVEYDNVPTSGFVLNKHVGGCKSGWNVRQSYCRIYDPRGFEFEITIDNLLFILANCDCTRGKGLEGEFVYAWNGQNLTLLPTTTSEYESSLSLTESKEKRGLRDANGKPIKTNLIPGALYKSAYGDYVYLGHFHYRKMKYCHPGYASDDVMASVRIKKQYIFMDVKTKRIEPQTLTSLDYLDEENYLTPDELQDALDRYNNSFHGYNPKVRVKGFKLFDSGHTVAEELNKFDKSYYYSLSVFKPSGNNLIEFDFDKYKDGYKKSSDVLTTYSFDDQDQGLHYAYVNVTEDVKKLIEGEGFGTYYIPGYEFEDGAVFEDSVCSNKRLYEY